MIKKYAVPWYWLYNSFAEAADAANRDAKEGNHESGYLGPILPPVVIETVFEKEPEKPFVDQLQFTGKTTKIQ